MAAISWRSRIEADDALVREGPVAVEGLCTRHVVTLLFGPVGSSAVARRQQGAGWCQAAHKVAAVELEPLAVGLVRACAAAISEPSRGLRSRSRERGSHDIGFGAAVHGMRLPHVGGTSSR